MKPLWDMDNAVNLQDFVILELKNLGIKVPRMKKPKSQEPPPSDKVFGNYLCYLPCTPVENCGHVPRFLVSAVEIIEQFIDTEGLFRKSGAVSRQKELKQQIEKDCDFTDAQVFDVTGIVKLFFRELPDPLLTNKYHDTFIKCYQLGDRTRAEACMLDLCLLLPGEHLGTLRFMMRFLARVADNSDVNKMDAGNLAVVLGPNIMHVNTNKTEKMNACEEKLLQTQTAIVEFLIRNADKVGVVSPSLVERLELMESLQADDNQPEIKLDTLSVEDLSKKSKKKKRRSSSLQGFVSNIAQSIAKWRTTPHKSNSSQLSGGSASSSENIPASISAPLPMITPKVMRKRKASAEAIAFSATKRKAILMQMPNTPFTPASSHKRLPPEIEKALEKGTPSINFTRGEKVEFTATPKKKNTPRKRLSLFSPSSARKSKSWSVTASSSSLKPSTPTKEKKKSLFRRLSGGRSKADSPSSGKQPLHQHVGERLASPAKGNPMDRTDSGSKVGKKGSKHKGKGMTTRESPISALVNILPMIHLNSPKPVSSDINLSNRFYSPQKLEDPRKVLTPQHISAPSGLLVGSSFYNTREKTNMKLHRRAKSADVNHIKRGKPNTVTNGLNSKEISLPLKVRRESLRRKVSRSKSLHSTSRRHLVIENPYVTRSSSSRLNRSKLLNQSHSFKKGTVNRTVILDPPEQFADKTLDRMEDDASSDSEESEAGFSTISGDTVIFVPSTQLSLPVECGDQSITRAVEKLDRAGKMSKLELDPEPMEIGERVPPVGGPATSSMNKPGPISMCKSPRKYSSVDNLQKQSTPSSVVRSQSLYETSTKKHHAVPNLMVSYDMRNMLARAGYVKEMKKVTKDSSKLETSQEATEIKKTNREKVTKESSKLDISKAATETKKVDKSSSEEMAPIKRATVNIVSHESVLDLEKAAKVASNVQKFADKQEKAEIVQRHTSPLRFPNSTTRTRGASPIRVPTIFAKSDNDAERFRQIAINALKGEARSSKRFGANLPISTQLLRPSAEATNCMDSESNRGINSFTRKPSIYKVRTDSVNQSFRHDRREVVKTKSDCENSVQGQVKIRVPSSGRSPAGLLEMMVGEDVFNVTPHPTGDFNPTSDTDLSTVDLSNISTSNMIDVDALVKDKFHLNASLQETINEVCTPLSEKLLKSSERLPKTPLREITVANIPADERLLKNTPHIRQSMLDKTRGHIRLRTASGMTPRHIMLANQSPLSRTRSPLKPLKRLGSGSPSPCRKSPRRAGKQTTVLHVSSLSTHLQIDNDEKL